MRMINVKQKQNRKKTYFKAMDLGSRRHSLTTTKMFRFAAARVLLVEIRGSDALSAGMSDGFFFLFLRAWRAG